MTIDEATPDPTTRTKKEEKRMPAFLALIIGNSYREERANKLPELAGPASDAEDVKVWLRKWLGTDEQVGDLVIKFHKDAIATKMKMEIEGLADYLDTYTEQKPLVMFHSFELSLQLHTMSCHAQNKHSFDAISSTNARAHCLHTAL